MSLATRITEAAVGSISLRLSSAREPWSSVAVDVHLYRRTLAFSRGRALEPGCLGPANFLSWRKKEKNLAAQRNSFCAAYRVFQAESCCAQLLKVLLDSQYRKKVFKKRKVLCTNTVEKCLRVSHSRSICLIRPESRRDC